MAQCPFCCPLNVSSSETRPCSVRKSGHYYRRSDRKRVQRYLCLICRRTFSSSTGSKLYYRKKRHLHGELNRLLVAGVSQRESARILDIDRKTVVRSFLLLAALAYDKLLKQKPVHPFIQVQFDDLETFEHTKCKPLSVTLAVEEGTRHILGIEVARMPAKGLLASIARKKYGYRKDERAQKRKALFKHLKSWIHPKAILKSDENPHYPPDVQRYFPKCKHMKYKGRRGAVVGQGELKKIGFDPLFSLNHTCAVLRERVNRLKRKTWSTTKKPERLFLHIALVAWHHNQNLPTAGASPPLKKQQLKGPV